MTLSRDDQSDLDRYFQLGHFEKSPSGPMWERAFIFSGTPDGDYHNPGDENVTAWPTAEQRVPAKGEPSSGDLELIGRVSRKLAVLRPIHRRALEAYHGDKGACCAERMRTHGRIISLFEFVPAGRALAKRERLAQGRGRKKAADQLIQSAVARQAESPEAEAADTVTTALTQALDLKERAEAAYSAATAALQESRTKRPLSPMPTYSDHDDED